jgi:hypothetical protein
MALPIQARGWGEANPSFEAPTTEQDLSQVDLFSHDPGPRSHPVVQPKLTVGAPNDKYEQEADHVAAQVMSMPESATVQRDALPEEEEEVQTKPIVQRDSLPEEEEEVQAKPISSEITPLVQRDSLPEEEEEPVQMKSALSGGAALPGFHSGLGGTVTG